MKEEMWKPIVGFEGRYEVSSLGRIRSLINQGKILTNKYFTHDGYNVVTLCKDGKWKPYRVNRLVAIAFIPNPNNYPQVNHINEIKSDNRVDNLEWCTPSYNILHSRVVESMNKATRKSVDQITLDGIVLNEFISISEAGRETGINPKNICLCCKHKRKTAGGYRWSYHNENICDNDKIML